MVGFRTKALREAAFVFGELLAVGLDAGVDHGERLEAGGTLRKEGASAYASV